MTRSWRRFIFLGFTGFLLFIALAWVVVERDEIRIEQHIGGPVFNVNTGPAAIQATGRCLAVLGMIMTYFDTSRTPSQPRHDDRVVPPQED